jgi:hypothetical protein
VAISRVALEVPVGVVGQKTANDSGPRERHGAVMGTVTAVAPGWPLAILTSDRFLCLIRQSRMKKMSFIHRLDRSSMVNFFPTGTILFLFTPK